VEEGADKGRRTLLIRTPGTEIDGQFLRDIL